MAKLFIIAYSETKLPKADLVTLFDKMPGVITWFSQMPGSFFIKTDDTFSAKSISTILESKYSINTYVVIRINTSLEQDYWGRLSKELWEHFK